MRIIIIRNYIKMKTAIKIFLSFLFFIPILGYTQNYDPLLKNHCVPKPDIIDNMEVLVNPSIAPIYPGGETAFIKYISNNIKAIKNDEFQAGFYITFIIDTSGRTRNPCIYIPHSKDSVTISEDSFLNSIASMPNWTPGEEKSKKINTRLVIPFRF